MSIIPWLEETLLSRPCGRHQLHLYRRPEEYAGAYIPGELLSYPMDEVEFLKHVLQDAQSTPHSDKNKFQANFDVQQFKPEEISVKVTDDKTITIEGKHEEKQDEHGYISRHFVRKYVLPENCDVKHVQSKLSSDGVLTITAPKINEEKKIEYREIPVIRTGQPIKRVEQQPAEKEEKQ